MTYTEYIRLIPIYRNNANCIRGEIINSTIELERVMDDFLSRYFVADFEKAHELKELIISDRIEFSKKTKAVISILKKQGIPDGE